jgi:microcystin-dependent protein
MILSVATNYAQISASQAGIAIQGIARNTNNTAITSQNINFTFTLYYLDSSNLEQLIFEESKSLTTDAFGVFSYIINPTAVNNSKIANNIAYLRIKNGSILISDEKINHVPYAIAANNGVPTGSIMPFIGTNAPEGWALCNGAALPTTATVLISMVGANAPNLQGMFLRGTGTSPVYSQAGPALKATQDDTFQSHLHASGTLGNSNNGNHNHGSNGTDYRVVNSDGDNTAKGGLDYSPGEPDLYATYQLPTDGDHSHTISGSTASTGDTETRPINYGVNYIIKL